MWTKLVLLCVAATLQIEKTRVEEQKSVTCTAETTNNLILRGPVDTVHGCPIGKEFITAFMANHNSRKVFASFELAITAQQSDANVKVNVQSLLFSLTVKVSKLSTKRVTLPGTVEMRDSGLSTKTVQITSDADISVVAFNDKLVSGDSSIVLPTTNLDTEYVVFTPNTGPAEMDKIVGIINGKDANTIAIVPYKNMEVKGFDFWQGGSKVTITLAPYEIYQCRSRFTFTGTRIKAKHPVAVLAGHQCSSREGPCSHVYEQLVPVQRFATEFLVPMMHDSQDIAYVVANEDSTKVKIAVGEKMETRNLMAGQAWEVCLRGNSPLYISTDKKVMVMYYSSGHPFSAFLTSIIPSLELANQWSLDTLASFENTAVIVCEANGAGSIKISNTMILGQVKWNPFPANPKFVWARVSLGLHQHHISITSDSLMAVYVYGGRLLNGYGTTGICYRGLVPLPPPDPCEKVKCREKEECHEGVCVHTSKETCTALGDPHYSTFDGKRFDFQGTCTYIIATTIDNAPDLTPFTILTKNDHRGNQRVAYIRTVTVTVYGQTVIISKARGIVQVNGQNRYLPVTLADGKLRVVWSGWYAVLTTDFGLEVKYDWDMKLYITAPSSYFRSLGGLCGNYNGDRQDDFTDPKGTKISTVIEFAKSWKVKDGDLFCHDDCVGECPSCSATLQEKYRSETFCGLMAKSDGPFSSCHGTIEPNMYIDNCVYDVCINKGYKKSLCDNMESYANFCQEKGVKLDISWRTLSDCPTECPENSHYEPCGTACPASCGDLDAPTKCKMACVEGCQCNTGFARSGDKCVPLKSCGCMYEGQYYPSGKEFWADSKCTQQCKCNPATAKVECSKVKCKNSQVCDLRNGVRDCYPASFGTCQGSGDPHYRTFDGKKFDFQGTCTYYLSKLVNTADPSLVPFEVRVQNQNRGRNRAVSYTKTVEITAYGNTVVLSKESPGKVLLNNQYVSLPFKVEDGKLSVFGSGYFGVVKTDFGLTLKFNWDSHVALTLPSSYSGEIGGLCGNWNGLPDDDMVTPDKGLAKTPTAFGISWKVRDDPGCSSDCNDNKCPTCQPDLMDRYQKREFCGIITDRNGPFKDCHSKVDPKQYFDDCAYDMCLYQGHATALCAALSAYTSACQEAFASVDVWRSDSLCPPSCKANSHYEVCATGCPQTCSDLTESSGCEGLPCTEGCVCDDGFLLSDGECVPMAECGCVHFGRSYKAGQVFFPQGLCEQRCMCQAGGRVQCDAYSCGPNEKCQVKDGVQACHPDGTGTCTVFGASRYRSFDSQSFSLSGDCMYKMVEVIRSHEMKTTFSVLVQQKSAGGDTMTTRNVEIEASGYRIVIVSGTSWKIMVGEVKMNLPLTLENGKVKAYQNGFHVIVEMDFGLKVTYDGISGVIIEIPSTYKGAVGGLCGNFNGDKADDFMLPSGVQAVSAEKFAEEWVSLKEGLTCHTGCGSQCPPADEKRRPEAEKACSILTSKDGPVSQCHSLFPPQEHFQECVQELITDPKKGNMLCQHIQKYVALCQSAGITVKSWRTETFCFVRCPANSHYELCADTCSSTCASLSASSKCPKCQEGCQCDDGFVFDGDVCVPLQDCGCFVDGHYYKSGESVIQLDCTEECHCEHGVFSCKRTECKPSELCTIQDGVMGCRLPDPCEKVKCREKEECHEGVCVHTSKETCTALGDPHYSTFDGKRFDFQGTCTYIIATTLQNASGLRPFAILTKNDHRGNQRVAYIRTVTVMVYNQTIVISKERGTVQVNGLKTFLPVTLADGKLRVVWSGWYAVLTTDFGLEVKYDWDMKLYITAPSSYFRSLGGLCGNYNGDRQDDFTDPKGTKISTVIEFAKSWKVKDGDLFCHDDCVGECPSCSATLQEKYRSETFCGLMAKSDGPFSSCHGTIEPNMYIDNCVYDVCINKGYKKSLCDNMESYANFCQEKGVKLDISWRTLSDCPTECPENSHYEPCGTACPASCGDLDAPTKCKMACVEGCQCNTGFARSGDKCVPLKSCGCMYEGQYYPSGKEFWADSKCTQQCKCNPATAKVECSKVKCKNSQVCDLRNGVRDCYPASFGTCQGSGDPHYRTFDGKKFDFQGTCTYYLSKLVNTADPSLVPFEVRVQNQNRGRNRAVSYTKTVEITAYGNTVVLSKESPGKVLLNNQYVSLPFKVEDGKLSVFGSGYFGVVKTDFGLTLKFNWDSHVALTLPSSYSGEIGGLCGNWNGLPDDDMVTPDKGLAKTPTAFGISWKVRDDPGCSSDCNDNKCPTCQPDLMDRYQKREFCGIITDRNGPFKDCHSKVDPKQYFDDCAYDMCLYQGHATALCAALSAYTSACQEAFASVDVWRADSLCPPSCKANSHYEVCATGCPQTCSDLTESSGCEGLPCTEGCVCDDGFLLSDGECVPMAECGCVHFGRSYKAGQVFFPQGLCEQRCMCQAGGRVQCDAYSCGPNEKCQVKDGVQACHPDGTGTCTVFGASRYRSFDSQSFSLSGDCMYKMVEVIRSHEMKTTFSVLVQQKSAGGDTMTTRNVEIEASGYRIVIVSGTSWKIMVGEVKMNLPLTLENGKVKAYQNGFHVIVEMDFGLKVTYDGISGVIIEIPSTYKGAVGGLCGNFNGDKADDFMLPSGVQAVSAEKFAEEWVSLKEGLTCHTGCGSQCPPADEKRRPEAEKACSILTSKDGPVSQCHSLFPPQEHFQECVQELITDPKKGNMLCQHIQKYVALCQSAGITVKSWRTETFCFVRCPANSHYELCADTCSSTCASLSASSKCPKCQEGCQCDDGFVFDGDVCVPLQDCGCFVDGHYYKSGESVIQLDCTEECHCEHGVFSCKRTECKPSELCTIQDGVMGCRLPDPCEKVKCREKEECHEGVCVHTSKETCTALGDPHYSTFDGKRFDFQGTCTYIIATTLQNASGLRPFAILTKNDHRGNQRVAYIRTVTVMVYNQTIVISKERGTVQVNGLKTFLPVTLADGKLRVVWSGWYAVLTTDFGLEVKYDWDMKLYITAPSSYFRSLGGLCGNYNGDRQDDFTDPKGTKISTVIEFAKSWKVKDGDLFCHDDCVGECPSCSATLQEKYRSETFCGLMAKSDGPFSSCHGTIEPNMYIDNCVYDVCINKGYKKSLCDNMESYANFCQEKGVKLDISWRTLSDCPTECPENSHYEPCGTACPASCGDLDAPTKCKMACVEGCQCNTGFARSGDKCVPLKSCGCMYEGQYYPSGKEFWADSKCTQQCKCNPATAKVECSKVKCKNSQVCDLRNGVRDCYPASFGTCQGSGDPHYRTFDGKKFDFQGTCTYYLSKLVNTADPSLVPFEVRVQNQNRGRNRAVSYTKTVEITAYGNTVVLSKESPGKVLLNNQYVSLPFKVEDGKLSVFGSGYFGVVKTDFGLTLKFNWDSHVALTLPSSYSGEIGGLCGNWNGLPDDDMVTPDKGLAKTPTAFGISWKVRDDPGCSSDCNDNKCPTCQPDLMDRYQKREFCGIITDRNGPFKDCHSKVDPKQYFDDCAYDMCLYQGHATALCAALSAYTSACQEAFASVDVWRADSLCPPSCKANSHYEVCATGCPQTCSDLTESSGCEGLPCTEGCVCDDGFLLSDGECVPMAECGCVHFGRSYKAGQVFFPQGLCEQRCMCQAGGRVQCDAYSCGPNEKCQVKDGVQACHPDGTGTCTVFGASRYRSFDSQSFSLSGDCMYKMVEVIRSHEMKTTFSVLVQQKSAGGDTMTTRNVEIEASGYRIVIVSGTSWKIMVGEVKMNLPLTLENGKVKAYQNGFHVIVEMDFGLKVTYDGISGVIIEIPSTYKGAVGGLCGNFNGDKADDFMLPSGVQAVSAEKFAEEWVSLKEGLTCHTGCGSQCPPADEKRRPEAEKACSILTSKDGPVSQCHSLFPPQEHFQECVQELITDPKKGNMLCQHIQKYVALCQSAGITVKSWRTETFCFVRCPANSHYELCADTCSSTCASLSASSKCPKCQEGCQCDDGFVFDGDVCVPLQDCGCFVDGHYYKSGQIMMWNNCNETCSCKAGLLTCKQSECKQPEVCRVRRGVMGCYTTDPCMELTCREKEDCVLKGDTGDAVCVPRSKASCWAVGDPHYQTFDGTIFGFQGTCSYTLAKTTGKDDSLTAFSIVNKNEIHGNVEGSFLKSASIKVKGHEISILNRERGKVRIDGVISNVPLSLESDSIKFRQSGIRGIMETDFGLQVTFDWSTLFMVTVTSSYYDNLAGICGTYNANQTDDFTIPSGVVVANITEWAQSWSVPDRDPFCWHYCEGYCPTCSDEDQELYRSTKFCGLIESKEGPFSQCHNTLAPEESASSCLYDVCLNKGRQEVYCAALTNYVAACQKVGGTVSPEWRQISNCPLICPENSHYELCGSPCPATCAGPIAHEACPFPCIEGCQCNDSFVLSGEKCVSRIEGCGCPHEGRYYMPDETFWADNRCQSKCTCDHTTRIVGCKKSGCKPNEECKVVDGIRDCYPVGFKTCTAQGDPHFQSFDGKRFDFQGNCVYKLAGVCSKDPNLESFDITLENNNRGNRRVSFAKVLTVKTAGNTFTISWDIPGKILVNDIITSLPYYFNITAVQIYRSGRLAVLETNFGLSVTFDWSSTVRVKVPSTYRNAMCGLCGNYNDKPDDDLVLPSGEKAKDPNEFGNNYLVSKVPGCSHVCEDCALPTLSAGQENQTYTRDCDIIIDKEGPLRDCMGKVDSVLYHENCVYDIVLNQGLQKAACDSIAAYVEECQEAGGKIEAWRKKDFCAFLCPKNSVYSITAPGCPATCYIMTSPDTCRTGVKEGCVCIAGFLLSNDQCVSIEDCGCHHEGQYYKSKEVFYPDGECRNRCVCNSGTVACEETTCDPQEICKVVDGVRGCHPKGYAKCIVFGSHYLTFDQQSYEFHGACGYTLVQVSDSYNYLDLKWFSVTTTMESDEIAYHFESVQVEVLGLLLIIETNLPWEIQVNGTRTNLPVSLNDGKLKVSQIGRGIVVKTNFGFRVTYDLQSTVIVTIPSTYSGKVSGLCGDYNGQKEDDFKLPSKHLTNDISTFGEAWQIEKDEFCRNICPKEGCAKPDKNIRQELAGQQKCGFITDINGPLAACHSVLASGVFFENCIYNSFIAGGKMESVCLGIEAYVSACQEAGVSLKAWRSKTFCPLTCPENSHYALCAETCHNHCMDYVGPDVCSQTCTEGCECDYGFVANGNQCVKLQNCGCNLDGMYIESGETIYLNQCSQRCTCTSTHNPVCESTTCPANTKCAITNGIMGCYPSKNTCVLNEGNTVRSFDGSNSRLMDGGLYYVVHSKDKPSSEIFWLLAKVTACSQLKQSLGVVLGLFGDTLVKISANHKVTINSWPVTLPWQGSDKKLAVMKADGSVTVTYGADVLVKLDAKNDLSVTVPNALLSNMKGLCGVYRNDAQRYRNSLLSSTKFKKGWLSKYISKTFHHKCN